MLTIQRQFSLPNCILILEGFNVDGAASARPLLSTLTRFECHFGNESQVIQGGRELLNVLAERVHGQAQALLSGVQRKAIEDDSDTSLTLRPVESGNYQLTIAETLLQASDGEAATSKLELKLNSVQLFDLVEALDQLMEDQQTLPDLALKLQPLSRKEAKIPGAGVQQFLPVGIGVASLALVAAISFVMPVPTITKPAAPESETNPENVIESVPDSDAGDASENIPPSEETDVESEQSNEPTTEAPSASDAESGN